MPSMRILKSRASLSLNRNLECLVTRKGMITQNQLGLEGMMVRLLRIEAESMVGTVNPILEMSRNENQEGINRMMMIWEKESMLGMKMIVERKYGREDDEDCGERKYRRDEYDRVERKYQRDEDDLRERKRRKDEDDGERKPRRDEDDRGERKGRRDGDDHYERKRRRDEDDRVESKRRRDEDGGVRKHHRDDVDHGEMKRRRDETRDGGDTDRGKGGYERES